MLPSSETTPSSQPQTNLTTRQAKDRYRSLMERLKGRYQQRRAEEQPQPQPRPAPRPVTPMQHVVPARPAPATPLAERQAAIPQAPARPVAPLPKPLRDPNPDAPYDDTWTKAQLYQHAKEQRISGRSAMNKAQLIEVLNARARRLRQRQV